MADPTERPNPPNRIPHDDDRMSLDGFDPIDALRALLAVNPKSEPVKHEDDEDGSERDSDHRPA